MYQLIEVIGRDIELSYYSTWEEAHARMKKSLIEVLYPHTINAEEKQSLESNVFHLPEYEDENGRFWWWKNGAFSRSDCEPPCDWEIVDLKNQEVA